MVSMPPNGSQLTKAVDVTPGSRASFSNACSWNAWICGAFSGRPRAACELAVGDGRAVEGGHRQGDDAKVLDGAVLEGIDGQPGQVEEIFR